MQLLRRGPDQITEPSIWTRVSPAGRKVIWGFSGTGCFGVVLWGLNQFLSLRGVIHLTASRIVLVATVIVAIVGLFCFTRILQRWKNISFYLGIFIVTLSAFSLDRWAPKPKETQLIQNVTTSTRIPPQSTITAPKEQGPDLSEIQEELRALRREIAKEKSTNDAKMAQSNSTSKSKSQILTLSYDLLNFLLGEEENDPRNIFNKSDPESVQYLNQRTRLYLNKANQEFKKDYDERINLALQLLSDNGVDTETAKRACFDNRDELNYVRSCSDSLKTLAQQLK